MQPPTREHGAPPQQLPADVVSNTDAMAGEADPWAGKKQSGQAYLGSPPLKRSQLQQLRQLAQAKYGVEIKMLKEGDELLDHMRLLNMRAGFQASTKTVFLQPQATHYEAMHELKHAEQCALLGVEAYAQQPRLDKEMYAYEQLMKERHSLTPEETTDALRYINSLRSESSLPLLTS